MVHGLTPPPPVPALAEAKHERDSIISVEKHFFCLFSPYFDATVLSLSKASSESSNCDCETLQFVLGLSQGLLTETQRLLFVWEPN